MAARLRSWPASVRALAARIGRLVVAGRAEAEAQREIEAHLALLEDEGRRRGLHEEEARRRARIALGGPLQARDAHRDARTFMLVDDLARDARYAIRSLRRTPAYTCIALLTLGLGIGATTAIFSIVHTVLLAPPPYARPDRLVRLYEHVPGGETRDGRARRFSGLNAAELSAVQSHATLVTRSTATSLGFALVSIVGIDDGAQRQLTLVTSDLFPLYGIQPIVGRWFTSSDEAGSDNKVVILSYDEWQRDFDGDPHVVGRTMTFNGNTFSQGVALGARYTVVGVMPRSFSTDDTSQLWAPAAIDVGNRQRRLSFIARLADGATPEAAAAEAGAVALAVRGGTGAGGGTNGANWPDSAPAGRPRFEFVRIQDEVGESVRPALRVLAGAVAFVLLIACANVANLLLARNTGREREVAVRLAIGAGRGRLVRQFLTESVLLSCAGGTIGVVVAAVGVRLFKQLATNLGRIDLGSFGNTFPRLDALSINAPVLGFAAATSIATGILFGLLPAVRGAGSRHVDDLRATGAATRTARRARAQSAMIVAEIALAIVLFVGGGLLIHSFVKLARVEIGFDPTNVLTFQVALPGRTQPLGEQRQFAETVAAALRGAPGVVSAGYANQLPLVAIENSATLRRTPAPPPAGVPPDGAGGDARLVSRDYLQTMGVRLMAGRFFDERDGSGQPQALIINRTLARRSFTDRDPVGTIVYMGRGTEPWEIVGVVDDIRQARLDTAPVPQFFASLEQWTSPIVPVFPLGAYYAVRTSGSAATLLPILKQIVLRSSPQASIENLVTMDGIVSNALSQPRLYTVLLGTFAGIAVLLACAGIYGVVAYTVAQRTHEIGIRMALGAERWHVLGMVLHQIALLTAGGTLAGLAGAAATTRYLQTLLFGLTPLDATTFVVVALIFGLVATIAALIPARRAAAVDPIIALRVE